MIILLMLCAQLVSGLKKSNWNKNLVIIMFIATIWNFGFLMVLHLELLGNGMNTYGSDESDYYDTMLYANQINNFSHWFNFLKNDFNFTYVLFGALILKTSWFESIFLIRLGNVLLYLNTVVTIFLFAKRFILPKLNTASYNILYGLLFFIATNGVVTWTIIRNLKDTLFIYALIIFIYLLFEIIFKKNFKITNIITILAAIYVLADIRQWFIYFLILLVFVITIVELFKKKRYLLLIIAGAVLSGILLNFAQEGLAILEVYTVTRFSSGTYVTRLPILMGQFILGPGPIRGLFGNEAFLFTTATGNVLIALGSLAWWFFLPLFFMALLSWRNIKQNYIILTVLLFYWATYSYANMGSGDTRVRAILYVLCVIYTFPYIGRFLSKQMVLKYLIFLFLVILIGLYFSYQTLT